MFTYQGRKLSASVPLYDSGDSLLYFVDREKAVELITAGRVEIIGTRRRIRALRLGGPAVAILPGEPGRKPQLGRPHRRESYFNPRGVWHLDRIPRRLQPEFQAVVTDCLKEAAPWAAH